MVRRIVLMTAALVAAVLAYGAVAGPPRRHPPLGPMPPAVWPGAYHVHSTRSDGTAGPDAIAAAASHAGLRFVILTDHGDATGPFEPPAYRHGVLCIDAVEIGSDGGHVVALGLTGPSAYPLGGDTRDVIEDIHRLGGWAVAAHPESPRPTLRWRAPGVDVDGVEWLNADSSWRGQSTQTLAAAALRFAFRPPETVAAMLGSGRAGLDAWMAAARRRPTFTLAAVDAHARLGEDPDGAGPPSGRAIRFPGYASMFRAVAQTVRLDHPLGGHAAADAADVLGAIAAGRSYSEIRAFVDAPGALTFVAEAAGARVDWGGDVPSDGPVTFRAEVPAGVGARLVLLRDGTELGSAETMIERRERAPGAYRVEVHLPDRATPWIVSNAIRVGLRPASERAPRTPAAPPAEPPLIRPIDPRSWVIEADRSSTSALTTDADAVRLQYQLGAGTPAGQYVALASGASGDAAVERLVFTASSERPMRVSVQIRLPGGVNGRRWRRSLYVDATPRDYRIALADLEPVEGRTPLRPIAARVQSILFVVDTVHAKPGSRGALTLRHIRFEPGRDADADQGR